MKKTAFVIISVLVIQTAFSQTSTSGQSKLDSISKLIIHYFQAKQADSIYALAGDDFKAKLTQENFKSIAETHVFPLNDYQNTTYINTTNGINKYKVAGTTELQLLIGLDKEDKIETLLVQPFSDN